MSQMRGIRAPTAAAGGAGGGRAKPLGRGPGAPHTGDCQAVLKTNAKSNKLPKSVRYDLENALLSLCDVWFEEIKPHLVRNNIKLHTDRPHVPPARADPTDPTPDCTHRDPGADGFVLRRAACASSAGCSSTPRTASSAPSRKPPPLPPRRTPRRTPRPTPRRTPPPPARPTSRIPASSTPPPFSRAQEHPLPALRTPPRAQESDSLKMVHRHSPGLQNRKDGKAESYPHTKTKERISEENYKYRT